jgi:hypothetical protein
LRELSLHLLDIAENSIAAEANRISISVVEDSRTDLLQMSVEDNGCGMSSEMVARVVDPFTTTRTTRKVGLGIPLLKAAAEACNGYLIIESEPRKGTRLDVQFQRSHIDRMPIGDLVTTILNLVVTNPQVNWIFQYGFDGKVFIFDDVEIKNELGDVPLTEPEILVCLKEMLISGIKEINQEFSMDHVSTSY